jgi:hypothetical protein
LVDSLVLAVVLAPESAATGLRASGRGVAALPTESATGGLGAFGRGALAATLAFAGGAGSGGGWDGAGSSRGLVGAEVSEAGMALAPGAGGPAIAFTLGALGAFGRGTGVGLAGMALVPALALASALGAFGRPFHLLGSRGGGRGSALGLGLAGGR